MRNRACRDYGHRRGISYLPKRESGVFAAVRASPGRRGVSRCLSKVLAKMGLVGESAS